MKNIDLEKHIVHINSMMPLPLGNGGMSKGVYLRYAMKCHILTPNYTLSITSLQYTLIMIKY